MGTKSDREKLLILLPHWVEHNEAHIEEMTKWIASIAGQQPAAAGKITAACDYMRQVTTSLKEARELLGTRT